MILKGLSKVFGISNFRFTLYSFLYEYYDNKYAFYYNDDGVSTSVPIWLSLIVAVCFHGCDAIEDWLWDPCSSTCVKNDPDFLPIVGMFKGIYHYMWDPDPKPCNSGMFKMLFGAKLGLSLRSYLPLSCLHMLRNFGHMANLFLGCYMGKIAIQVIRYGLKSCGALMIAVGVTC